MNNDNLLFTPAEIIRRNPFLKKKWTAQSIGYLFKLQIVKGVRKSRFALVDESDVLKIFFFSFPSFLQGLPVVR